MNVLLLSTVLVQLLSMVRYHDVVIGSDYHSSKQKKEMKYFSCPIFGKHVFISSSSMSISLSQDILFSIFKRA